MKNNVDLTENRMFSGGIFGDSALSSALRKMLIGSKFPWDTVSFQEIHSDEELRHQKISLIALGNKKQRAEIAEYRKMDSLDYCDCCGARMNLEPWDIELGVCHKCNDYYEKQNKDKCPWRKKTTEFLQRRISVFDMN